MLFCDYLWQRSKVIIIIVVSKKSSTSYGERQFTQKLRNNISYTTKNKNDNYEGWIGKNVEQVFQEILYWELAKNMASQSMRKTNYINNDNYKPPHSSNDMLFNN